MRMVVGISLAAAPIIVILAFVVNEIGVGETAKFVAGSLFAAAMIVGGIYLATT